ncbi:MAG: signal peptidase I [Patescibacteria group bacterium]
MNKKRELLYYTLVLGFLVFLFTVVFLKAGIPGKAETYSVRSGSMAPSIPEGSLVWVSPSDNYQIGDVITFKFQKNTKDNPRYQTITHRIAGLTQKDNVFFFITKGEANQAIDGDLVDQKDILGKVILSIPRLGYLVDLTEDKLSFFLLFFLPGAGIVLRELKRLSAII